MDARDTEPEWEQGIMQEFNSSSETLPERPGIVKRVSFRTAGDAGTAVK